MCLLKPTKWQQPLFVLLQCPLPYELPNLDKVCQFAKFLLDASLSEWDEQMLFLLELFSKLKMFHFLL